MPPAHQWGSVLMPPAHQWGSVLMLPAHQQGSVLVLLAHQWGSVLVAPAPVNFQSISSCKAILHQSKTSPNSCMMSLRGSCLVSGRGVDTTDAKVIPPHSLSEAEYEHARALLEQLRAMLQEDCDHPSSSTPKRPRQDKGELSQGKPAVMCDILFLYQLMGTAKGLLPSQREGSSRA